MCLEGAREVLEKVLRRIPDERLSVLVVWEPILWTDSEVTARLATRHLRDPRARQYWAPDLTLGEAFQRPISLSSEPAWDVYLLYEPGVQWTADPPRPTDFMHQLADRLPASKLLDADVMAEKLSKMLAAAAG
jgi:hypothetical protein